MDGHILGIFYLSGRIQGIFEYVRQSHDHSFDHAVDVFLYVLYSAGRGDECTHGGEDFLQQFSQK